MSLFPSMVPCLTVAVLVCVSPVCRECCSCRRTVPEERANARNDFTRFRRLYRACTACSPAACCIACVVPLLYVVRGAEFGLRPFVHHDARISCHTDSGT